jgi:nucleoside-diphosphate-sugar epimerase
MGYDHVVPELYQRARQGENPLTVYSTTHTRAFCYVSDAITATITAMRAPAADGQTLNIGNDREEVTIGELAQRILQQAHLSVAIQASETSHDPIQRRCPDLSRTRGLLRYEPQVLLHEGLEKTIAWYRQRMC